jgi:hypothetical protein
MARGLSLRTDNGNAAISPDEPSSPGKSRLTIWMNGSPQLKSHFIVDLRVFGLEVLQHFHGDLANHSDKSLSLAPIGAP